MMDAEGNVYKSSISINEKLLPFLKSNDVVTIKYTKGEINSVLNIEK